MFMTDTTLYLNLQIPLVYLYVILPLMRLILIKVANTLASWLPNGLGMARVLACGLFGAISGSTVMTIVALGGFMIPSLLESRCSAHSILT